MAEMMAVTMLATTRHFLPNRAPEMVSKYSREEEEERGEDSKVSRDGIFQTPLVGTAYVLYDSDACAKGDEATHDVDDAKRCCCLDIVRLLQLNLLLGPLHNDDHLVDGARVTLLIHIFKLKSVFINSRQQPIKTGWQMEKRSK